MSTNAPPRRHPAQIALLAVAAVLGIGLALWGLKSLLGGGHERPRKPPTVTLMPDTPPPPPPKEERKPEPPKEEKKEMRNEPPKEAPPAQNAPLKMEGAAGDGGSPFAAGSVGRDYVGGSIGSALQNAYAGRLQRHLQEELNRNRKLRESDYRITVRLWLRHDGTVERAELAQSAGNAALDQLLRETLLQIAPMREAPPDNMPQPIRIRITARGAG
ncbi:TonB C-terminal domain-containing protein [Rhodocyclus tenuis]|uniref:TonB family protein n=2 Tax=Rhodocyclus TaxID=1064 RepID=A0A6L5JUX3_RHOTE|nr:energy transducer TonB [Rhodocyclus gracilis]MQY51009.1 TonB family protein [Rhodocyclus gracilis]MRD72988.1 TonB family protein [Rhodocyclus gracilis]NJA88719.1 TonB C-terminal domain-containing protein [Rhodocyclus gracilis]